MRTRSSLRLPALLCCAALGLAAGCVHPALESGILDDFSYARTTLLLAQTGHVHYHGFATTMLGWLLYAGALEIKLFGFSFTGLRLVTLVIGMATAFVAQRTFARSGLKEENATLATLMLVLSPVFLSLSLTFMTDVPAVFVIFVCLYACLRALQAESTQARLGWIVFAVASNAIGGTVRQIAWLGVLVMVPSALWLMRRRPRVLSVGVPVTLAGAVFVWAAMHWLAVQPFSVPETMMPERLGLGGLETLIVHLTSAGLMLPLLLLPALVPYVYAVREGGRKPVAILVGILLFVALGMGAVVAHEHREVFGMVTMPGSLFTRVEIDRGAMGGSLLARPMPAILKVGLRLLPLLASVAGMAALAIVLLTRRKRAAGVAMAEPAARTVSWFELGVLLAPFCLAYIGMLCPRATGNPIANRYVLPVAALVVIPLIRYFQDAIAPKLPKAAVVVMLLLAAYGVALTHDFFVMSRTRLDVVAKLHAAGVADPDFDAGPQINGWSYLERYGYLNEPKVRNPPDTFIPTPHISPLDPCHPVWMRQYAKFHPVYGLSFDRDACGGAADFAPTTFRTWLPPRTTTIYIIKYADKGGVEEGNKALPDGGE